MSFIKGGRGVRAPYESITMRVPVPIKDKVQKMVDDYRNNIDDEKNDEVLNYDIAIQLAQEILNQKKGAKISLQKLLTAIYHKDVIL